MTRKVAVAVVALLVLVIVAGSVVHAPGPVGQASSAISDNTSGLTQTNQPINVPFISQYQGQQTQNYDCGPASVAMISQYFGRRPSGISNKDFLIQVRNATGNTNTADTNFGDLERAVSFYGLNYSEISNGLSPQPDAQMQVMKDVLASNAPVIAFIHGANLGRGDAYGDHWLVVTGFSTDGQTVYLNDPDTLAPPGSIRGGENISLSYSGQSKSK